MPKIQGKSIFSRKLVLPWCRREDSASRTETLGDFFRARGPKNLFSTAGLRRPHNLGLQLFTTYLWHSSTSQQVADREEMSPKGFLAGALLPECQQGKQI
jgi:hypothetical protein